MFTVLETRLVRMVMRVLPAPRWAAFTPICTTLKIIPPITI